MIEFIVPGRAVPQPRPRVFTANSGKTRAINSIKSREYKKLVRLIATSYRNKKRLILSEKPIALTIDVFYSIPKSYTKKKREGIQNLIIRHTIKPDADNLAKGIMDALTGIFYKDDSQIVNLIVSKNYGVEDHVRIEIKEL